MLQQCPHEDLSLQLEEQSTAVEPVILKKAYSLTSVQWVRMKQYNQKMCLDIILKRQRL